MQHNGSGQCKCARCEAIAGGLTPEEASLKQLEWEVKCLTERGFYVHYVGGDPTSPTNFNAHTHGLERLNHLNFQFIVQLPQQVGHNILCTLAEWVKEGQRFESGQLVEHVIRGFPIKLVEASEDDRKVLRIIFPDPKGNLEPDEMNEQYVVQYQDIEGVEIPKRSWEAYKPK